MSSTDKGAVGGLGADKLDALVEMMFLAASADGEFSATERAHFQKSVESLTDGRVAGEKLEALIAQAERDLAASDRDARLAAVKARLPDPGTRKAALSLAIQVVASDGIIRTSERELILETADALEIDRDEAANLVRELAPKR
jgi:uncharacterized tellurite resistance protein B-like protein